MATKSKKQAKKSADTKAGQKTRRKSPAVAAGPETTTTSPARSTRPSALNAAAEVLAKSHEPMNCQEMIAVMAQKGLWTSPAGKTPAATLYSSILKEIRTHGAQARFRKVSRGKFAHT